jgi:hypothetical protein
MVKNKLPLITFIIKGLEDIKTRQDKTRRDLTQARRDKLSIVLSCLVLRQPYPEEYKSVSPFLDFRI